VCARARFSLTLRKIHKDK